MIIKNINKEDGQWHATLVEEHREINITIQKGGGQCDWVAYNADNPDQMWEILGVFKKVPDIETWKSGDRIELGNAIKPSNKQDLKKVFAETQVNRLQQIVGIHTIEEKMKPQLRCGGLTVKHSKYEN